MAAELTGQARTVEEMIPKRGIVMSLTPEIPATIYYVFLASARLAERQCCYCHAICQENRGPLGLPGS